MAETDSLTGLDLGTMAAYATLPKFMSMDNEVEHGLSIISSGAKVWPGNQVPISEEVIENYQAAWVVEALEGIVLRKRDSRKQNPGLMHNPLLDETIDFVDSLFAGGVTLTDIKFGRAITNKWTELVYSDHELDDVVKKTASYVVKRAPHLSDMVKAKEGKAREVYMARGTVREEAIDLEDIEKKLRTVDMSKVPPAFVEVIDEELVEPSSWNLGDVFRAAGTETVVHDFPYYSMFGTDNGKEVLKNILEDLAQLREAI